MAMWSVTCADMHYCVGPFPSKSLATRVAMKMTEREAPNGCVYVPVPMDVLMMVDESGKPAFANKSTFEKHKKEDDDSWVRPGQYL